MAEVRILVLDEDSLALELYTRELALDYPVTATISISEARQLLKQKTFGVFILEPASAEDEGWTLLKETRAAPNPPRIVLISVEDERKTGLELGAEAYLVKPVLPMTLHRLLDRIVANQLGERLTAHDQAPDSS